jgi:hypothetical protein
MDFDTKAKSGIYLRNKSIVVVVVKKKYAFLQYTKWDRHRNIWMFTDKERVELDTFMRLNREPARVLYYYAEKWDYGQTKKGLYGGELLPNNYKKLWLGRRTEEGKTLPPVTSKLG